jgi:hypothetical protein
MKPTPIARVVYGYTNADVVIKVKQIIEQFAEYDDDDAFDDDDWLE